MADHIENIRNDNLIHKAFSTAAKDYAEADQKLAEERHRANAQAMHAEAYRQMPADLRQQAETWGVGTLMELVWLNGWDCGYRQSVRDAAVSKVTSHD